MINPKVDCPIKTSVRDNKQSSKILDIEYPITSTTILLVRSYMEREKCGQARIARQLNRNETEIRRIMRWIKKYGFDQVHRAFLIEEIREKRMSKEGRTDGYATKGMTRDEIRKGVQERDSQTISR